MFNEVYDWRAQAYLKKLIDSKLTPLQKLQVRSISHCNETINKHSLTTTVDLIVKHRRFDGKIKRTASFVGQATCKNTFACPHCEPHKMARYSAEIKDAIIAMKRKGYECFMMTFTVPHIGLMSCREVTDILFETWQAAFANVFARRKSKDGSFRYCNPYNKWAVEANLKHYVRALEYTWSKLNGWHPHFHCLFWAKRGNDWDSATSIDVEKELNAAWIEYFQKVTAKYWAKHNLHGDDAKRKTILARLMKFATKDAQHPAMVVTRQKDKRAVPFCDADYIAGFESDSGSIEHFKAGESELAGSTKKIAHHEGHYTPAQILDGAMNGNAEFDDLYIEFLLNVTRKPVHHRVNFSKSGIKAEITQLRNSEGFQELLKKKEHSEEVLTKRLCSFNKNAWYAICELNRREPVLACILSMAQDVINNDDLQELRNYVRDICGIYKGVEYYFDDMSDILPAFDTAKLG